jgi:signal transduction histidine kinase
MTLGPDLTLPGLAHDLNNVFQTLVEAAYRLDDEPAVSAAILRAVERGQRITHSMLGGGSSATLAAVVASARAFTLDTRPEGLHFACEIDPEIELRHGWAWERVMINLFVNSSRAMPKGGLIHVTGRREGRGVVIVVSDEGSGIPAELLSRLFEPYVSGNGSSGLGLHIVRTIVEQDGGSIEAINTGRGAEFRMHLPAAAPVAAPRAEKAHAGV